MSAVLDISAVQKLEDHLLQMPQADIRTFHTFYRGFYERKIVIPAWTVLTGAEHKTDYKVRIEKGTIAVNTDDGIKEFSAPCEFHAKAGIKRAGRVFEEEVIWVDVYENPDNCMDLAAIEERIYVVPECGLGENRVALLINEDRKDYQLFLDQLGLTEDGISSIVKAEHDLIPMPGDFGVELRDSPIHGKGMFATAFFSAGDLICPGRVNGCRTPAGRFINHSANPNVVPVKSGDDIMAFALRDISENEELLVNYRTSMLVNFGVDVMEDSICQAG